MKDKDIDQVLSVLSSVLDPIFLFTVDNERCLSADSLPNHLRNKTIYSSFQSALNTLLESLPRDADTLAICGSFLAVQAALTELT